jgi:hypothetical protein
MLTGIGALPDAAGRASGVDAATVVLIRPTLLRIFVGWTTNRNGGPPMLRVSTEAERPFAALSEGGSDVFGLQDMAWQASWGTCPDRFGIRWMINAYST